MNIFRTTKYNLLSLFLLSACTTTNNLQKDNSIVIENPNHENLKKHIGKKITVIGKSVNMKIGAVIITEKGQYIWMDKMDSWPIDYYSGENNAKTLKVTGILIEKNDLPVFVQNENANIAQQGIPVPKGTNLKDASQRFLLKKAKWSIIE